jgi:hypothetical protein
LDSEKNLTAVDKGKAKSAGPARSIEITCRPRKIIGKYSYVEKGGSKQSSMKPNPCLGYYLLGVNAFSQKYEYVQINQVRRMGRTSDDDSLEFNRVALVEKNIGGVFYRQMVVRLVSELHCLAGIYHHWLRRLLPEKVS